MFPLRRCLFRGAATVILTDLPDCVWPFVSFMRQAYTLDNLSVSGTNEQRKRKIIWKAVKAPLWHKHKRNGPCIISLNYCLGVRQSPFLRLCGQSAHVRSKSFWAMVCRRIKPLLRKSLYEKEKNREIHFKISRFIVTFAYEEFFEGYVTRRRIMQ